jgi:hypothetical protein
MQFEGGKPPETPSAPYQAARIKDERWRSAGPRYEPGRAGPRLSLTSSQDEEDLNPCHCAHLISLCNYLQKLPKAARKCFGAVINLGCCAQHGRNLQTVNAVVNAMTSFECKQ